ncbi:MAG: DNA repair protein RecO [Pseudomonadota bacterium]
MEWQSEGVLIARRRHGESGAIVELFTEAQGRHAGFVPGGAGRKLAPILQPGAQLSATWRARLAEQIGTFRVEPIRIRAAAIFEDRDALAALASIAALLCWCLPEREAHPALYRTTIAVLDGLGEAGWPSAYARWELALLREMGFGPDLSRCAVTGARANLAFVALETGQALGAAAADRFHAAHILPLPGFLIADNTAPPGPAASDADIAMGLAVTGFFLEQWLSPAMERPGLPPARIRCAARLAARAASAP